MVAFRLVMRINTKLHENILAGLIGFEPMNHGVKDRCLNRLATTHYVRLGIFQRRRYKQRKERKTKF